MVRVTAAWNPGIAAMRGIPAVAMHDACCSICMRGSMQNAV